MRQKILATIIAALEPLDFVLACWQGGSQAWGYTDEWSDIDLQVIVEDSCVEATFEIVEAALQSLAAIQWKWRMPEPTWHGHSQCFYQFERISPFLTLDFVVMKRSNPNRFLEVERNGNVAIAFDKTNLLIPTSLDRDTHFSKMAQRLEWIEKTFAFQQILVKKEINRGLLIEAISGYHTRTLNPLIELLGMAYRPYRYDFMAKYLSRDLPGEICDRIKPLYCITDLTDLTKKQQMAEVLFAQTLPHAQKNIEYYFNRVQ
ncbi:MAG: nucleotidyltransferase domain-containing protein [Hydrococcus sp. CRU_1_1]|nr:nucleotidyltransferase domain-containing protein [Hydrococcus sp. CRU_1_1]